MFIDLHQLCREPLPGPMRRDDGGLTHDASVQASIHSNKQEG